MGGFLRLMVGLALLPTCWGVVRTFLDCFVLAADGSLFGVETLSLVGGMLLFVGAWVFVSHPVKAYVLGHELTHALWGVLFGARPSKVRVSKSGGSVLLTKTNVLITLAPYFFPFYTFLVIVAALVVALFVRPLPWLPAWMLLVGFTWAFHVFFTIETLSQRQPDVTLYGRIFSWTFIFVCNVLVVLVWMAATTRLSFGELGGTLVRRTVSAYAGVVSAGCGAVRWACGDRS